MSDGLEFCVLRCPIFKDLNIFGNADSLQDREAVPRVQGHGGCRHELRRVRLQPEGLHRRGHPPDARIEIDPDKETKANPGVLHCWSCASQSFSSLRDFFEILIVITHISIIYFIRALFLSN